MELLLNQAIYRRVILELLPQTQKFLWIVTADIKDLHVPKGRRFVPLLEILSDLIELMDWIDQLYLGEFCLKCQRRAVCPDPIQ